MPTSTAPRERKRTGTAKTHSEGLYEKTNFALPSFNLVAPDFSHPEIRVENGTCDTVYVFSAELRECNISL
jgi:hypothetical protein